jgi:hypothetical protein
VVAAAPIDAASPPDAAAAAAVEPPPVEPARATVTISIESTPPGALVFFNKERKARGKTPLTFEVPRADKEVEIDLELSGHHSWEKQISVAGNQELDAVLVKRSGKPGPAKPGPAKPGPPKPGPSAGDNTLNPFD